MVLDQHHTHYYPAAGHDQAGSDDLYGHAPLSPVLMAVLPNYYGGRPTPPPSPRATGYTGHFFDEHAPCPPTPPLVPYSVDEDELQWLDSEATGPSTYYGTRDFMPLSELHHYTSFGPPSTYDTLDELASGHVAQDDISQVSIPEDALGPPEMRSRGNPVLVMIKRAELDEQELHPHAIPSAWQIPDNADACFASTGGVPPPTGKDDVDRQTHQYYSVVPFQSMLRDADSYVAYHYSIRAIQGLQHSLKTDWYRVFPKPIPAVLIRTFDIVGPYDLRRGEDGYAYVVPTEDTIWGTVLERGINHTYRPIANSQSVSVTTTLSVNGAATYHPQEIVGSRFAVNVFLELPRAPGETVENPYAEYLGAYVLKVIDGYTIKDSDWRDIDPEVQAMVYDRAPHLFEGLRPPHLAWPYLPLVQFCFYKWDGNVVGLMDEIHLDLQLLAAKESIAHRDGANSGDLESDSSGDYDHDHDSSSDYYESESPIDSDSGFATNSVGDDDGNVSSGEEYSFLDLDSA
ncbi:hypothetical protein BU15DRAFT_78971 [Melanogaster broomeanus]|nr:hypothetical protein BU15DRAFT_78971 [Melanogaster broomeanus]